MRRLNAWVVAFMLAVAWCVACAGPLSGGGHAQAPGAFPEATDARLATEVASLLHRVPALAGTRITAHSAVVRLEGAVADGDSRMLASSLAAQQPGVGGVENRVTVDAGVRERLRVAADQVEAKLIRLFARAPLLLVSVAIVLLAAWIGRVLARRVHLSRFSANNPYFDALVARTVRWMALLVGVLIALDLLDARSVVGAVLGSAGVAGIAIGFAFRDIAENYVAGVLLSLRRPFAPGDHILVEKYEGKVVALTSRSTLLLTLDGVQVALPNALVFKSVVTNYSQNAHRRFEFTLVIDSAESIRESQQIALAEIAQLAGVLADPPPSWSADGYMGGGIQLRFLAWVDQRQSDLRKVRSEAIRAVKVAFEKALISSPQPVQYVFSAPLPADVARRLGVPAAHESGASGDTSVDRDIDQQLDEQRVAHNDENLI